MSLRKLVLHVVLLISIVQIDASAPLPDFSDAIVSGLGPVTMRIPSVPGFPIGKGQPMAVYCSFRIAQPIRRTIWNYYLVLKRAAFSLAFDTNGDFIASIGSPPMFVRSTKSYFFIPGAEFVAVMNSDGTTLSLWVNGELVGFEVITVDPVTNNLFLTFGGEFSNGDVDPTMEIKQVGMWKRSLRDSERDGNSAVFSEDE